MNLGTRREPAWILPAVAVVLLSVVSRVSLALFFSGVSPDGEQYLRVAENILLNGCISLSDVSSQACVPHWGGNHPPGYPIAIAAVWVVTGVSIPAALIMQSTVFAVAAGFFTRAVAVASGRPVAAFAAGLVLALSPLQVGWARLVLPDMLAVAGTIWVFAELFLSLHERRLRVVQLGFALTLAFFARYDGIFLVVPVAVVGFIIHRPLVALRRGAICAMIFAVPILVWSARNVAQGLSFVPDPFLQDGGSSPKGYLKWGNTWVVSLYDGAGLAYPLQSRDYERITINAQRAFANDAEKQLVRDLLEELRTDWPGKPFPPHIDERFRQLATARTQNDPFGHYVFLPLSRAIEFWANPFYSYAWPIELDGKLDQNDRERLAEGSLGGALSVALKYPVEAFGKAGLLGYRALVVLATIAGLVLVFNVPVALRAMVLLGVGFALFRTLALSFQPSVDSRYMIPGMAVVEAISVLALVAYVFIPRLQDERPPLQGP